jgi:signal transduction histidine kinase
MSETGPSGLPSIPPRAAIEATTTLLVVDDYQSGRYVKTRILSQAGFHVLEATTGEEALCTVAEHRPALVVLDIRLPDIDGIAVCRAIKADPATASTMVLQVSAYYTSAEDQVQGLDSGADAYIPGDIAPALLVAAVRALLRTRRAEEALRDREERLQLVEALDRSQKELRALAASLFTAQEEERRRIARELHDDLSQRMALLEIGLTKLRQRPAALNEQLDTILGQISLLSEELRHLSHTLHPSVLEHLGLEAGLRSLCEGFERTHNIRTRCIYSTDGCHVPLPTATVFYRIAQEALRNVAKHAGDAGVTITLSGGEQELCLTIQDDGCGFDPEIRRDQAGLGLISMQERVRLVGGRVEVRSAPGEGTAVKVWAPWPEESRAG